MVATPTRANEIDRKLHRIVLDSNPKEFSTRIALARSIQEKKYPEFSYSRGGRTEYSIAETIQNYVSYACEIGILDGNLVPTRRKSDIRSLENFQQWLSDTVVHYMNENNCSLDQIGGKVQDLLRKEPHELPTPGKVHSNLENPPTLPTFKLSIKIISLLRPLALQVKSRRVILMPEILIV